MTKILKKLALRYQVLISADDVLNQIESPVSFLFGETERLPFTLFITVILNALHTMHDSTYKLSYNMSFTIVSHKRTTCQSMGIFVLNIIHLIWKSQIWSWSNNFGTFGKKKPFVNFFKTFYVSFLKRRWNQQGVNFLQCQGHVRERKCHTSWVVSPPYCNEKRSQTLSL